MNRALAGLAALNGTASVALGAFGAHGLRTYLDGLSDMATRLQWWDTGAHYHSLHAVALLGASVALGPRSATGRWIGACWLLGIVLFCGSLYAMSLTGMRWLGAITPVGGLGFLAGWSLLSAHFLRPAKQA